MHKNHPKLNAIVLLSVACFVWTGGRTGLPAWAQHAGHTGRAPGHAARRAGETGPPPPPRGATAADRRRLPGGQYRPQEIRVYLYESSMQR
jgi:hypothetical protein